MTATYTPLRDQPLFCRDGDLLVPGVLAKGPWYEGSLHGSAMLAAMARAAEQHPTTVERQVVRLTVDMMRAAPMAPLRVEAHTVRSGKSTEVVDITMSSGGEVYVRGSALRIRTASIAVDDVSADASADVSADASAEGSPAAPAVDEVVAPVFTHPSAESPAFHHAIDVRVDPSTGIVWFRLAVPIVDDEPHSSTVTIATIADWTYATPRMIREALGHVQPDEERTVFAINADTTINTHRPMSGAWVGLRTTSVTGGLGAGTSSAQIVDHLGLTGFASQSVLVRGPSGAPLSMKELPG